MSSRSGTLGGNALRAASETIRARLLDAAAVLLEASPMDLVLLKGAVAVRGVPDRCVSFQDVVARLGEGPLSVRVNYSTEGGDTFPFGFTIASVSIDPESGYVDIERFIGVGDCGKVLNPVIVEGQLDGGLAQGIGEALLEQVHYDDQSGQLVTGSLLDYAIPSAARIPRLELERTETPSPRNPLGMKGVGESGAVSGPPDIANALFDALRPSGVRDLQLPMTSERIWQALRQGHAPK